MAELCRRAETPGRGRGQTIRADDEGSARPVGALLRDAQRLLEGRHGWRARLRRRGDPAFLGNRRCVSRLRRVPHVAHHSAGRHALQHRPAAPALRYLGEIRLRTDRAARPVRRHHVPGHPHRERAGLFRGIQRARFRSRRRGRGRAHLDLLRGRRALRTVMLRRGAGHAAGGEHLPRRDAPPVAALQVQVQVLGLCQ